MESSEIGFLLGASPGIFYILRNMKHMLRMREKTKASASEPGTKWLELSSWSDSVNSIFHFLRTNRPSHGVFLTRWLGASDPQSRHRLLPMGMGWRRIRSERRKNLPIVRR